MIPFAATLQGPLQQRLPMLLNGPDNPQNLPLPLEGFAPPSNTWFLTQSAPEVTKFGVITENKGHYAIQGHRFWYRSKAHVQLPISD